MNVLITGGYGFIGSTVAERFYKEGHRIYVIDNLSTGSQSNLTIPHKSYLLHVEDRECEEIFRSASFDIVVHLAAQVDVATSLEQPVADTQANVLGLVNMLNCSRLHGVKKFIFASSAAVYGSTQRLPLQEDDQLDPKSPYGISKRLGETYCDKWRELYNLDTLCFRFSNVYGPRQGNGGEGGVISIFLNHVIEGKQITVFGDGTQTRDFIYVEDVADAIYRGASSDADGVYNLSTGTERSLIQLIDTIRLFADVKDVQYREPRLGDIERSSLDNGKIKRKLDWVPLYNLDEGLARTYEWLLSRETAAAAEIAESRKKTLPEWLHRVKPFAENLLAFAVVYGISRTGPGMLYQTALDYRLIYILLIALLYGTRQSLLSAAAVIGLFIYDSLDNGRDWGSLLYDPDMLLVLAVYLFFGLSVGFIIDKYKQERRFAANELTVEQKRYRFLQEVYKDTRSVKESLQRQVLSSKDSVGRIYSVIGEMESLEPEQVVSSAVTVLEELMESRKIAIYSVSQTDYIRLLVQSNDPDLRLTRSLRLSDAPQLAACVRNKTLWVNKELESDLPMLAAPIVHEGETVALICIYETDFERFTLYYEHLFKVAADLFGRSLSRAFTYVDATRNGRFIDNTAIMQETAFRDVLQGKRLAKEKHGVPYTLLKVEARNAEWKETAERLSGRLRETDYLGVWKSQLVLLLSNTALEEAEGVVERLARSGIETEITEEEAAYA